MTSDNTVPKADQDQATYENAAKARRTISVEGYTQRIAYNASGFAEYLGLAVPGSTAGATVWQIRKLVYTGNNVTSILWCDGNSNFDNTWTNYDTHSYS